MGLSDVAVAFQYSVAAGRSSSVRVECPPACLRCFMIVAIFFVRLGLSRLCRFCDQLMNECLCFLRYVV